MSVWNVSFEISKRKEGKKKNYRGRDKVKRLYAHTDLYIAADHHHDVGLWCYWGSMALKIVHVQIKGSMCFRHNISAKLLKPPSIFLLTVENQGMADKEQVKPLRSPKFSFKPR